MKYWKKMIKFKYMKISRFVQLGMKKRRRRANLKIKIQKDKVIEELSREVFYDNQFRLLEK